MHYIISNHFGLRNNLPLGENGEPLPTIWPWDLRFGYDECSPKGFEHDLPLLQEFLMPKNRQEVLDLEEGFCLQGYIWQDASHGKGHAIWTSPIRKLEVVQCEFALEPPSERFPMYDPLEELKARLLGYAVDELPTGIGDPDGPSAIDPEEVNRLFDEAWGISRTYRATTRSGSHYLIEDFKRWCGLPRELRTDPVKVEVALRDVPFPHGL